MDISTVEKEVEKWLLNKLGTSVTEAWSSQAISGQITKERLIHIPACFLNIPASVKLRLLMCILHLSRRNLDQWSTEIDDILSLALHDTDDWVQITADLIKGYPTSGSLSYCMEQEDSYFSATVDELSKKVSKFASREELLRFLPLDSIYMNKNARDETYSALDIKNNAHFKLRRKPKSAALRKDLIHKAQEASAAAKGKRNTALCAVPIPSRNMAGKKDNNAPLKGLPTLSAAKTSGGFGRTRTFARPSAPKKEGGTKFLEDAPPITKRKRRAEADKKQKADTVKKTKEESPEQEPSTSVLQEDVAEEDSEEAMRRIVSDVVAEHSHAAKTTIRDQQAPLLIPANDVTRAIPQFGYPSQMSEDSSRQRITIQVPPGVAAHQYSDNSPVRIPAFYERPNVSSALEHNNPFNVYPSQGSSDSGSCTEMNSGGSLYSPLTSVNYQPHLNPPNYAFSDTSAASSYAGAGFYGATTSQLTSADERTDAAQEPTLPSSAKNNTQPPPDTLHSGKKPLTVTKELMAEAQELFRDANKVSRPEKAVILAFIAGSRDNPCPKMGNLVTIRLSENVEQRLSGSGISEQILKETFLQMDYDSGTYRKFSRNKVSGPRKHLCPSCGKMFKFACRLKDHMSLVHSPKSEGRLECKICQRRFPRKQDLDYHSICHLKGHHFCLFCPKWFETEAKLSHHLEKTCKGKNKSLSPEKLEGKVKCDFCDKSFKANCHLERHMRTHDFKRPFVCEICAKAFSRKYSLTVHERTHAQSRPFKCSVCSKDFNHASNSSRHGYKQHGFDSTVRTAQPTTSSICPKKSSNVSSDVLTIELKELPESSSSSPSSSSVEQEHFKESGVGVPQQVFLVMDQTGNVVDVVDEEYETIDGAVVVM